MVGCRGVGDEGGAVVAGDAHHEVDGGEVLGGRGEEEFGDGEVGAVYDEVAGHGGEFGGEGEGRDGAETVDLGGGGGAVCGGEDGVACCGELLGDGVVFGVGGAVVEAAEVAEEDGAGEFVDGFGGGHEGADRSRAGGLAEEGYSGGVTSKVVDVGSDPVEGGDLVGEAEVAVCYAVFEGEEAEGGEAVVDGYEDHVASGDDVAAVKGGVVGCSAREGSSVDPDSYWAEVFLCLGRFTAWSGEIGGPDVEEETVLGSCVAPLDTLRAVLER